MRAAAHGATVVQDYQRSWYRMLRMLRPDLTIGFFLHILLLRRAVYADAVAHRDHPGPTGRHPVGFTSAAQNFLILSWRSSTDTSRGTVGGQEQVQAGPALRTSWLSSYLGWTPARFDHAARDRNIRRPARDSHRTKSARDPARC